MVGKKVTITCGPNRFRVARVVKMGKFTVKVRYFETGETSWVRIMHIEMV